MTPSAYPPLFKRQMDTNTYFSPCHRLLYVATPKVACTSLKWWFAEILGVQVAIEIAKISLESDPELVIHDTFARVAPEYTGANEPGLIEALTSPDYFRFCVVRNPFTRVFSAWQSKWLLREPLQGDAYPYAVGELAIESREDIRTAFEAFLRVVATVDDPSRHDVHVAPQWALLEPQRVSYQVVGQIEEPSAVLQALSTHLGPGFRNPLSGGRANESLLPYTGEWISEEAANLIRIIYARDFELFGYDTAVPPGRDVSTDSALAVALRSIKLLRGRNARIGELIGRVSEMSSTTAIGPSTMQVYWSENQGDNCSPYAEDRSSFARYQIDGVRKTLVLVFPVNVARLASLRFDLSNQPAGVVVHRLYVEEANGHILWEWDGDENVLQFAQGVVMRPVQSGLLTISFNHDPQCLLVLPKDVLECFSGGVRLKVEMTPRPLHEICAEVLSQDDRLIADLRGIADGKLIVDTLATVANEQSRGLGVSKGLEEVANMFESNLARRDQIISEQAMQIRAMRDELLRAEAQLDLLKDLMLGGGEVESL